jgi:hypothetical protein
MLLRLAQSQQSVKFKVYGFNFTSCGKHFTLSITSKASILLCMTNKSQITIAAIALLVIIASSIFIFYKSGSQEVEIKSSVSASSAISSSQFSSLSSNTSTIISSQFSLDKSLISSNLAISSSFGTDAKIIEAKSKNFNCELNPDDYTEIIDLENDCLAFSSRSMCDFDNKEPEIKELKPQLYDESIKLYNNYKSKIISKYSSVVMSCEYIDKDFFEFGLNLYDQEYFKQKTGEYSEGPAIRFSKLYSATKNENRWEVKQIKDTSFDFENPPKPIQTPPCLFPPQAEQGLQRIVQQDYGCYNLTIQTDTVDMSNKTQNDYFTYRTYDIDVISREFAKDIYKDFSNQKLFIVAKDFNFMSDSKYTFTLNVSNSTDNKYSKTYTLEKKRNNSWVIVK